MRSNFFHRCFSVIREEWYPPFFLWILIDRSRQYIAAYCVIQNHHKSVI